MNGEESPTIIFIVANSSIVRAGLETVMRQKSDFVIAGSASDFDTALSAFSINKSVDVILVNIEREKDFDDLNQFLEDSLQEFNLPALVALVPSEMLNAQSVLRLLQGGMRGILPNDATANEIIAAILAAASDLTALPSSLFENLLDFSLSNDAPNSLIEIDEIDLPNEPFEKLTPRETEILEMLADGASNKAIAYQLEISEHTVKFHVASIFGKFGVNTRTEAVTQGLRRGLILL